MQNLTDQSAIDKYSEEFSDKILNEVFRDRERISGQELLNITPVRQVNLFVIKSLLFSWKKETEKLKSPYFDYSNEEVQKALSTFMNTVSRNISVQEIALRPLLQKAVYESICLIFFPYDFYTQLIDNWSENNLALKDLKQINKYVKVNDSVMNNLVARMEQEGKTSISKEEANDVFTDIMEHTDLSPADTEEYLQQFNAVHPLSLNNTAETKANEAASEIKEAPQENKSFSDDEFSEEKEVDSQPENAEGLKPKEEQSVTLNDEFQRDVETTLSNIHEKQKIEKISKYISINQKFMFINRLFDKDWGKFEKAIAFLDETDDKRAIVDYLDENAPAWREEGDEAEEFRMVLERKLGASPI